ncbi:MAG TPA: hypothetical protein O0X40_06145 [Methanocorpusculum sp.]|nr:hypothetical protein [Methanocorpusculum sp.]
MQNRDERMEKISEDATRIAKEKYIRPMTRIFLFTVSAILLIFGLAVLIFGIETGISRNLIAGCIISAAGVILLAVSIIWHLKNR